MANYTIYDNLDSPLRNRFRSITDDVREDETLRTSLFAWQQVFDSDVVLPPVEALENLLDTLKAIEIRPVKSTCPRHRLFVSHRHIDKDYGLRVANLANDNGFEFWLDVLDPALAAIPALTHLPPKQIALFTACIIEMGLINSTHVLAVMTENTKGGDWVPYEYGRVRRVGNTGCWKNPCHNFNLPDYMELGEITKSEVEITKWLKKFPSCSLIRWNYKKTVALPWPPCNK
jgi:hypothetical protein